MNQKDIVSQHIGSLLYRSDISVTDMLGVQSQFLRYSKWVAKVRGIDMDASQKDTSVHGRCSVPCISMRLAIMTSICMRAIILPT